MERWVCDSKCSFSRHPRDGATPLHRVPAKVFPNSGNLPKLAILGRLPLLAVSFLMLAPLFVYFAPDMTRKEVIDFVEQKVA